jgi:hypothetical protein
VSDPTFAGRRIEGEVNRYSDGMKPQHDVEDYLNALDNLLNMDGVVSVRHEQYTPYFNDGEPCVFSAGEARVLLTEEADAYLRSITGDQCSDYDDGFRSEYDLRIYDSNKRAYEAIPEFMRVLEALRHYNSVLGSGHHDQILNEKFGDPSVVTADKNRFDVVFYDHD